METIEEYEITETPLPFRIEDDSTASWAMRRFAALRRKMLENEEIAKAEADRIMSWLEKANRTLAASASYFEEQLVDYARRQRNEQERKSVALPYGTVKSRQCPPKIEVDDAVFIPWAQENRDDLLIFAPPKPNKTALKTESDIPGVVVVEGGVSFSIEVAK